MMKGQTPPVMGAAGVLPGCTCIQGLQLQWMVPYPGSSLTQGPFSLCYEGRHVQPVHQAAQIQHPRSNQSRRDRSQQVSPATSQAGTTLGSSYISFSRTEPQLPGSNTHISLTLLRFPILCLIPHSLTRASWGRPSW